MRTWRFSWDPTVDNYVTRSDRIRKKVLRALDNKELAIVNRMVTDRKSLRILCTELIVIRSSLLKMDDDDLNYVMRNLYNVISSTSKQSRFLTALKLAFTTIAPDDREKKKILSELTAIETRIAYLRKSIVPENLELTPIHEYLDIRGCSSIEEDLYAYFTDRRAMYAATNGDDPESLNKYAQYILDTVSDACLMDIYKERLAVYVNRIEERKQKEKEKKQLEKEENELLKTKEYMIDFQRMFHNADWNHKSNRRIFLFAPEVHARIVEFGRGSLLILCCYLYQNKPVYRYLDGNGELTKYFKHSKSFVALDEANQAIEQARKAYPGKLFDIVELSHVERKENAG